MTNAITRAMQRDDILRFYDDKGHSWHDRAYLVAENERLQARVAELERIVLMQQKRWRQQQTEPPSNVSHH